MNLALQLLSLIGFIGITACTAVFVAAEFSLTALEKAALDRATDSSSRRGRSLREAHSNLSYALSGAQVGITITTLITGYLAEPVLAQFLVPLLRNTSLNDTAINSLSLAIALVLATILSMVYGELLPKNWAISEPLRVAHATALPLMAFSMVFRHFIEGLNKTANNFVRRLGVTPVHELASARSPEELDRIVQASAEVGNLPEHMATVVQRSLRFGRLSAEDIMTPRSRVITVEQHTSACALLELSSDTGHSRFPVVNGDLDSTLGIIHVKDAFALPSPALSSAVVDDLMKPLPRVPDSLDADAVLSTIRASGQQSGLVIDEYGGAAGLVTVEDIVEEILGDVRDEHDMSTLDVLRCGVGWECSGQLRRDEVNSATGFLFPNVSSFDTLGGLIMWTLGKIPLEGDQIEVYSDADSLSDISPSPWLITVLSMDDRRVNRVLLTPLTAPRALTEKEESHE